MKRFFFWSLLTIFGILCLLRLGVRTEPATATVVVRTPDGRTQTDYVDRHGKVIEIVKDRAGDDPGIGNEFVGDGVVRLEPAEGLPVPVVPGSRTTEARAEPPSPSRSAVPADPTPRRPRGAGRADRKTDRVVIDRLRHSPDLLTVSGRLSATEDRARNDAREKLEDLLTERLAPEVPRTWKVPPELIDGMIRQVVIVPHNRDYGTVYEATLKVDFSPQRRAEVVAVYQREVVLKRLVLLGGLLAFVLFCLAAVSGYIKTDEATKGYYTTRLRLAAAAGVGAAGVVLYRWLV